jgi:hypothetical protein
MRSAIHRHACRLLLALIVNAALAGAVSAQDSPPPVQSSSSPKALITPFFALGDDLAPGGGGAFTFDLTRQLGLEAEASLGTDAARSSLSLLYRFPQWGRWTIYAAGGGGVQRDEDPDALDPIPLPTQKKTEFAVNIGAGVTVPVSERWAYRADFRWYNPKAEWPESWRVFSGVTFGVGGGDQAK